MRTRGPAETVRSRMRRELLALLVAGLLVLIGYFEVVAQGRTLSPSSVHVGVDGFDVVQSSADAETGYQLDPGASAWQFEPWAEVNHRALLDGDLPLWNPYQAAGAPHAANMQSAPFDPLLLPVNLHPTPLMWDAVLLGAFVMGAMAMYGFGRVIGLSALASLTGSAAFSLSGFFFLYSNVHFARSYIYLPILFLLVELTLRSGRLLPVFGLGLAVAGNLVIGMPETSVIVIGSAVTYGVLCTIARRHDLTVRTALTRLAGGFALGFLLAAPLLLLLWEYLQNSFTLHTANDRVGERVEPLRMLVNWVVPFFNGRPSENSLGTGFSGVRNWFGGGTLALALAGLSARRGSLRFVHPWIFAVLAGLTLLKIYDFGVLDWVGRLPVLSTVNFPQFAAPLTGFAVAALAAVGAEAITRSGIRVPSFVVVAAVLGTGLAVLVRTQPNIDFLRATSGTHALGQFGLAGASALAVLTAVLLLPQPARAGVVLVAVVGELLLLAPRNIYPDRVDPLRRTEWMEVLDAALEEHPDARVMGLDGKLFPNTASAFGYQDIRAVDGLYVNRYWTLVKSLVQPAVTTRFVGGPFASEEPHFAGYTSNEVFNLLGVRFVLAARDDLEVGVSALRRIGGTDTTWVYENLAAYPRVFIVHSVDPVPTKTAALSRLGQTAAGTFDPRREAVIETDRRLPEPLRTATEGCSETSAAITRYEAQRVVIRAWSSCPGLLVLSDVHYPGWEATVDGEAAEIFPTDVAFRGVPVSAGASVVEFRYRPRRFGYGVIVSLLALGAFGLLALARRTPARRWLPRMRSKRLGRGGGDLDPSATRPRIADPGEGVGSQR